MDTLRIQRLLKSYDRIGQAVKMRLVDRYSSKLVWEVIAQARKELLLIAPKIPYIGEKNIWQFNLNTCVMNIALYRTLKKRKFELDEAVQIQFDIHDAYLASFPTSLKWIYRWYYFSGLHQNRLRWAAEQSQKRSYPGDWVFYYVEGDGHTYDFGVDISECAIVKFCRACGAGEEYLPHMCKLDHALSKALSLGFMRKGTLAEGAPVCDCRWKLGLIPA